MSRSPWCSFRRIKVAVWKKQSSRLATIMEPSLVSGKTVGVFCLFVCIALNDLSWPVHGSELSQTVAVEGVGDSREAGSSSVRKSVEESGGKEGGVHVVHHHHPHPSPEDDGRSSPSWGSVLDVSDDDDDGDEEDDVDGDEEDEDTVKFGAVISERHTPRSPPCRRHQRAVTFDTLTTPTTLYFNPHTSTFTAPFNGLYIFSVNIQLPHGHQHDDVHIAVVVVSDTTQTVVCSISSQHGDARDRDSVSLNTPQESAEHRDDLHFAKWEFEEGSRDNGGDWDQAPRSTWERNWETKEVEGFCKGVKHLRQGQQVLVRLGNLEEGRVLEDDTDVSDNNFNKIENVKACDIASGFFSGSLLTRDI